jgi:hypothetical protein
VFPNLGSTNIPFSSYPLKAKYVELIGKDKGYNSSQAYCKVKGWSKKIYETFPNDLEKGFESGMMEERKMDSYKKDFEIEIFFSSQNIDFPFLFTETLGAFLFPSSFSHFFNASSLWGLGDFDDKRGEKYSSKFSFQMKLNGMARPWLWKFGSCGYIGGGRILQNGVLHANFIGWG